MKSESDNIYLWIIYGISISLLTLVFLIVIGNIDIEIKSNFIFEPEILLGLVAAVIAIFNIREIKKQRIKMYEPRLVIGGNHWDSKNLNLTEPPFVKIRNIGYGAAINIRTNWNYADIINNDTKYIKNFNEYMVEVDTKVLKIECFNKQVGENANFEFVLPVSIEKEYTKLPIPWICIFQLLGELGDKKIERYVEENNAPYLVLDLEYQDVNEEVKKELYKVFINLNYHINDQNTSFTFSAEKYPRGKKMLI